MSIKGNTPKFDIGKTTEKYSFNDFKMLQEFYNKNTELVLREKELAAIGFYTDDGYLKNGSLLFKNDYNDKLTTVPWYFNITGFTFDSKMKIFKTYLF